MPSRPLLPAWHSPFLEALRHSQRLSFEARSGTASQMQWNHQGSGSVQVTVDGDEIRFDEQFTLDNGLPCTDRKAWRFTQQGILFRHWRQQQFQDILLLVPDDTDNSKHHAHPTAPNQNHQADNPIPDKLRPEQPKAPGHETKLLRLIALAPYRCPPDLYVGSLTLHGDTLVLTLRITGTRKDECIQYRYQRRAKAADASSTPNTRTPGN